MSKKPYCPPCVSDRIYVGKSKCLAIAEVNHLYGDEPMSLHCSIRCCECPYKGIFNVSELRAVLKHYWHHRNVMDFVVI